MSVAGPVDCCARLGADVLSDAEAEATADVFKALGDPARVRIVAVGALAYQFIRTEPQEASVSAGERA